MPKSLSLAKKTISSKSCAFVMGILNATPDSFFSRSRGGVKRAMQLIEEGADILDIGGESSRPGSEYISEKEEIKRIVPVIKEVRKHSDIPISVDTRKSAVMEAAFFEGADILNDISALEDDDEMLDFVAKEKIPVILMHKKGTPETMQKNAIYNDVVSEVSDYLEKRADFLIKNGVFHDKIIIDPGIGFAKNLSQNIDLIKNLSALCSGKYPVLIGLSRKSFLGEITGETVENRLSSTIASNILAVQNGATMLRVHDVKETVDALKVLERIKNQ